MNDFFELADKFESFAIFCLNFIEFHFSRNCFHFRTRELVFVSEAILNSMWKNAELDLKNYFLRLIIENWLRS